MPSCRAALLAAAVVMCAAYAPARADLRPLLSLDDAFQRVVERHPDLAIHHQRAAAASARIDRAAQRPAWAVGASIENVLGSGTASGFGASELTVSLSSVIERGSKQAARTVLAERRAAALSSERDAAYLDLMAETARRYLEAVAANAQARLWAQDAARRQRTLQAAAHRVAAGGASPATRLAAEAALVEAQGRQQRALRAAELQRLRLALLWGGREANFLVADALDRLPEIEPLAAILDRLEASPELRVFAGEQRIREARLQLARSERVADLGWEIGVRRPQGERDWALIGSLSLPFGAADRAAPAIREAEAELAALALERDSRTRALEATLAAAHAQHDAAMAEARQIDDALLPLLTQAEQAARRAYHAGAIDYRDWSAILDDIAEARERRLQAALIAHRALIELQRLTGHALQVGSDDDAPDAQP